MNPHWRSTTSPLVDKKSAPRMGGGVVDVSNLKVPSKPTSLELQWRHSLTVAADGSSASPKQVMLGGGEVASVDPAARENAGGGARINKHVHVGKLILEPE